MPNPIESCPETGDHLCRHERQSLLKHNVQAWNGAPALSWIISYIDCAVPGALVLMKSMILPLSFKGANPHDLGRLDFSSKGLLAPVERKIS